MEELRDKENKLTKRVARMNNDIREKREEIVDLQTQLAIPQDHRVDILKTEVAEKDRVIAEQQARIEQLVEGKVDTSQLLAKNLGEKEALLAKKNKDMQLEIARVQASKTAHTETRRELEKCKRKLTFLESQHDSLSSEPMVDVEFESISKSGVVMCLEQVKDNSKDQSKTVFSMRQELDATKVYRISRVISRTFSQ